MAYVLATRVLLALLCLNLSQGSSESPLTHQLLLLLPLQDVKEPTAGWERGLEILPGAHIAAEIINNSSDLQGHQLQLIPIDSGRCEYQVSQFKYLPQLINLTFNQGLNVKAAIGYLCHNEVQIMLNSPSSVSSLINKVLKIQPVILINTLLSFMQFMEWSRIGIITELNDFFFFNTAEAVATAIEENSNLTVTVTRMIQIPNKAYKIEHDLPKVLFLSLSPSILVTVLCSAYTQDLLWPKHVWMLHSYRLMNILTDTSSSCNISKALEGAILINEQLTPVYSDSDFYNKYIKKLSDHSKQQSTTLHPNVYAYKAYDLVWETAMMSFSLGGQQIAIDRLVPHWQQKNMNIIQIKGDNSESHIATYSANSGELSVHDRIFKDTAPSDELSFVVLGVPPAYTIIFSIFAVIVFIIETSVLILYICFRKEPEVKSTSFSVSLFMFFGCYLCNIYVPVTIYSQQPLIGPPEIEDSICQMRLWLSNFGIFCIEATLLVKILRVYHIFFRYKATPIGKKCSDIFLACYIVIILSPIMILYALQSSLENYGSILVQNSKQSHIEIERNCGPNKPVWYILLIVYGYSLSTALAIAAIKTRKIRYKHFKDTRKVNTYLFCFTIITAMTIGCYLLLDRSKAYKYYLSPTPIQIGLSMVALLCQFLLFVPKVFPPFKRYITARCDINAVPIPVVHTEMVHVSNSTLQVL